MGKLPRGPSASAALTILTVVALYLGAAWLKCRPYGNATALVGFGCSARHCWAVDNRGTLPPSAVVSRTGGYDGQFYYYLGRELGGGPTAVVDSEAFRRARVGLPVLASPLLALGTAGRVYGLSATLLGLHLWSVGFLLRARPNEHAGTFTYAVNPFSLWSFLLSTADGAALSLAVVGLLVLEARKAWSPFGAVILAAALLTKETLLAVPAAVAATHGLDARSAVMARIRRVLALAVAALPMFLWWRHVGFSFGLASEHGGAPFTGALRYLPHADCVRALLACVLIVMLAAGVVFCLEPDTRASGFLLLGVAALVSLATAEEYWATGANIGRMFTPMAAVFALLDSRALRRSRPWAFRLYVALAASSGALTLVLVAREATRAAMPFFVLA